MVILLFKENLFVGAVFILGQKQAGEWDSQGQNYD